MSATTVVHRQDFTRRIGGVRVVPAGTMDEAAHLAAGMTWKSAAAGVAVDGMKCLVSVGGAADSAGEALLVAALQEHMAAVRELDPGVIFGPDMGSPAALLARVAERSALLPHLTGLPTTLGGLDINALGFTAHGVHEAVRVAWSGNPQRAIVQGFGAVGGYLAGLLHQDGWRVVGLSNRLGTLADAAGLDIPRIRDVWRTGGDEAVAELARRGALSGEWQADPMRLWSISAELVVPAARTSALALPVELERVRRLENPYVANALEVMRTTGVQMVAEAANHPLTPAAEAAFRSAGVTVLPDVLVNGGGFIGCWVEWALRTGGASLADLGGGGQVPSQEGAAEYCVFRTRRTVRDNLRSYLTADGPPRDVADAIVRRARERLLGTAVSAVP
jgi:glutamate dehydrogenase/leucine dehydrogenase